MNARRLPRRVRGTLWRGLAGNPEYPSGVVVGIAGHHVRMRGMTNDLTIGERVAWYRRRRGLSQEVLAGLVVRTTDWLSKVENNRIELDRLSVVTSLAEALDVSLGDLLAEPTLMDWTATSGRSTTPALRAALTDYRNISPLLQPATADPPALGDLADRVGEVLTAYQDSRFGDVTRRLPRLLANAHAAVRGAAPGDEGRVSGLLALSYQAAAMTLTKVGEADLAWIASERSLAAAQQSEDPVITASAIRSVVHSLLSNARHDAAVQLTRDAVATLPTLSSRASAAYLSVYGTLFLAGAMAAARADDRQTTRAFLDEAHQAARRLGDDANHMWTSFGPTNVAVHRVATSMELGDVQVAVDLGPRIDTSTLPTERRVRHTLEVARALSAWNRRDDALALMLDAERAAPEQVRYHYLSRQLVLTWIRQQRGRPPLVLTDLARRLRVA